MIALEFTRRGSRYCQAHAHFASFRIMEAVGGEVKLFGKWSFDDVNVADLSLQDYISVKTPTYLPHTAGRYQAKRFRKALCPIVERLVCAMMMHGRNNGKKCKAVRIVKHCFEIIRLMADKNPIQVFVEAVQNGGPREDSTRVGSAGVVRRQVPFVGFECAESTTPTVPRK